MKYSVGSSILAFTSTADCPIQFPQPKFKLGEVVQWLEVPNPDFGRIIGVFYTHEASCQITGLHYLILLDKNSPSHTICAHDFAYEDDIERFSPGVLHETN